jgi:hypothetical protein
MLHTTKTSLAKELWINRLTIDRMIKRWEVREAYNSVWKKHYVHVINFIKELVW